MNTIHITDEQFEIVLEALCFLSQNSKGKTAKLASKTYDNILEQSPTSGVPIDD